MYSDEQLLARREWHRSWRMRSPDKVAAYHRNTSAWRKDNPDYMKTYSRWYHRLKKYGITPEQWWDMFAAQGVSCAACGAPDPAGPFWHTDHKGSLPCRHSDIRGILCRPCNQSAQAGSIADILRLRDLVLYLEQSL